MAPQHLEVGLLGVVGHAFVAEDGLEVVDAERATVLVALGVGGLGAYAPRTLGVDLTGKRQVDVVADGQIVTAVAQIEAAVVVVSEGGEDDAGRIVLGEGEISERQGDGQGQAGEHHVGGAGDDVLAGNHLALGELEVEVGALVVVAGCVFAVTEKVGVVGAFLGGAAVEVSFALLGYDVVD